MLLFILASAVADLQLKKTIQLCMPYRYLDAVEVGMLNFKVLNEQQTILVI
jgi:hypothetical protein